jgi:hypothetical protein
MPKKGEDGAIHWPLHNIFFIPPRFNSCSSQTIQALDQSYYNSYSLQFYEPDITTLHTIPVDFFILNLLIIS